MTETETQPTLDSEHHNTDMLGELATKANLTLTLEHVLTFNQIFLERRNVLITGGAGVGKTTFVKDVVIPMMDHLGWRVGITATTGIAGSHLDGKTVHSWLGIGLGPGRAFEDAKIPAVDMTAEEVQKIYQSTLDDWYADVKMRQQRQGIMSKLNNTDVLLIDEISMCGGLTLLGYIDFYLQHVRDDQRPFGGMQLLLVGDMAQLPPVNRKEGKRTDWAFLSPSWRAADIKVCQLTQVFRQCDQVFANFLNRRRVGVPMTDAEMAYIKTFVRPQSPDDVSKASYLVATNAEADKLNDKALEWYPEPTTSLAMLFHIPLDRLAKWYNEQKAKQGLRRVASTLKESLRLRVGTPVLFKVNDREGTYVNGTKGFVENIIKDESTRAGTFWDGAQVAVRIPPRKGSPEGDKGKLIMVSRSIHSRNQYENPEVRDYAGMPQWPAMRQFPLIPATAITVHSAQGMSLDECTVDLSRSFAPGHVYVALSRLRTPEGLTLVNDNFKMLVDRNVVEFYQKA